MQVCSLVTAKKYDYFQIILFVLYVLLVIVVFIIEDIYLFKLDSISETDKLESLVEVKEILCWGETGLVTAFLADMILHAIGYGQLYLNSMVRLLDVFVFTMYVAL